MKLALLVLLPLLVAGQVLSPSEQPSRVLDISSSAVTPTFPVSSAPSSDSSSDFPPVTDPLSPESTFGPASALPSALPPFSAVPSAEPSSEDPSSPPSISQVTPTVPVPTQAPAPSDPDSPPSSEDSPLPENPIPPVSSEGGLPPLAGDDSPPLAGDDLPPLPGDDLPPLPGDGPTPSPENPAPPGTPPSTPDEPSVPDSVRPVSPDAPTSKGRAIYHLTDKGVKCLDVSKDWRYDGSPVQLYDCNGTPAQKWILNKANTAVRLAGTKYCLDAGSREFANFSLGVKRVLNLLLPDPANFVTMKIWQCYDIPAQRWYFTKDNRIAVADQGLCLDLKDGKTYKKGRGVVQTYKCTDYNTNQVWSVRNPH